MIGDFSDHYNALGSNSALYHLLPYLKTTQRLKERTVGADCVLFVTFPPFSKVEN